MFRLALSLLVCLLCCGCSAEIMAQRQAALKAKLEAAKLPPVSLSETQIAKLKEMAPHDEFVWYGAGRQSDGAIFVCFVTSRTSIFGVNGAQLFAGTFESDGAFHRSMALLVAPDAVADACRTRGFDPPVRITRF